MKLYLSGPMSSLPDFNRPAFNQAARELRAEGYEVISPVEVCAGITGEWQDYMRHDIRAMMDADAVAVLIGYENSRGAMIEVALANELGMAVHTVGHFIARALEISR